MSEKAPKTVSAPAVPVRRSSGEHLAVQAMRAKQQSISDTEDPSLLEAFETLDKIRDKSSHPPSPIDPRRDGEEEIPVDVVDLEFADPFPSPGKK